MIFKMTFPYEISTEPIFCKIGYLDEMNNHLAEARDRILPKLLSGEIEL